SLKFNSTLNNIIDESKPTRLEILCMILITCKDVYVTSQHSEGQYSCYCSIRTSFNALSCAGGNDAGAHYDTETMLELSMVLKLSTGITSGYVGAVHRADLCGDSQSRYSHVGALHGSKNHTGSFNGATTMSDPIHCAQLQPPGDSNHL
ncbi:Hypothetical predicted protein, partial [Scomber scombrus]